jgi:carboxymethylenebutenolidase
MASESVLISTPDGQCDASLHVPDRGGPWPAVVMFPDAGGTRDTFRQMGARLSQLGFVVLVPNPYYRSGYYAPFSMETAFTDAGERARLMALAGSLTTEQYVKDATAYLDYLASRSEVAPGPVGTTGYCMGGRMSLTVAGYLGERIGAAASFHGGRLALAEDPDSPHTRARNVSATVLVAAASNDASFDDDQEARLRHAYDDAGVDYTLETYPALHGFAVPDNPTYDETAAERHWTAMADLFTAALKR